MDNTENICEKYYKLLDLCDEIESLIDKSEYQTDSDISVVKHNFYTNWAITVPNILGELARVENDVIEAEFACDPDMKRLDRHAENINTLTAVIYGNDEIRFERCR